MSVDRINLPASAPSAKSVKSGNGAAPGNDSSPDNFAAALKDQKQALVKPESKTEPVAKAPEQAESAEPEKVESDKQEQEALTSWLENYLALAPPDNGKADAGNNTASLLMDENPPASEQALAEPPAEVMSLMQPEMASIPGKTAAENSSAAPNKDESATVTASLPKLSQAGQTAQASVQTAAPAEDQTQTFEQLLTDATEAGASAPEVKADFQQTPKIPVENRVEYAAIAKPLNHPGWSEDLGEHILWMNNKAISAAEIKLNPVELGPISVRIDISDDNQASIQFAAQHAETREALESSLPKLREMLQGQQLSLVNVNVSQHSGSNQNRAFAQNFSGSDGNNAQPSESMTSASEAGESGQLISKGLLSLYA